MEEKVTWVKNPKKIMTGFAVFLLLMWVFTLVSKSIYAAKLPQVTTAAPEKKGIEHVVNAEGIVKQGSDVAINTLAGIKVEKIYVRAGDEVEEDTSLFKLSVEGLEEIIEEKKLAIAKLNYERNDILINKELAMQGKQKNLDRANEDYADAQTQSDTMQSRAESALSKAQGKLDDHLNNGVPITSGEERQKAYDAYSEWVNRGKQLDESIAQKQVQLEEIKPRLEASEAKYSLAQQKAADAELGGKEEEIAAAKAELETAETELTAVKAEKETAEGELAALQEELNRYKETSMNEPDFSGEDSAKQAWDNSKKVLEEGVQEARYNQEDAITAKEGNLTGAERKVEDALEPSQADSTADIYKMELEQLNREIEKYRKSYKNEGNVVSGIAGTVVKINITTGEKTPDGAAIVCADKEVPYQFEAVISKEQKKYVNLGDEAVITFSGGKKEELQIDYLAEEENNPGSYRVVVYLPEGAGKLGMSAGFEKSELSESYDMCIPVESLYSNAAQTGYVVYLACEREGILGSELYAQQRNIKVLDKNDRYAAIDPGSLTKEDNVIISADKGITPDMTIRMKN